MRLYSNKHIFINDFDTGIGHGQKKKILVNILSIVGCGATAPQTPFPIFWELFNKVYTHNYLVIVKKEATIHILKQNIT